jgi:hypothetical protein
MIGASCILYPVSCILGISGIPQDAAPEERAFEHRHDNRADLQLFWNHDNCFAIDLCSCAGPIDIAKLKAAAK